MSTGQCKSSGDHNIRNKSKSGHVLHDFEILIENITFFYTNELVQLRSCRMVAGGRAVGVW